jgi:hypothetical protein
MCNWAPEGLLHHNACDASKDLLALCSLEDGTKLALKLLAQFKQPCILVVVLYVRLRPIRL